MLIYFYIAYVFAVCYCAITVLVFSARVKDDPKKLRVLPRIYSLKFSAPFVLIGIGIYIYEGSKIRALISKGYLPLTETISTVQLVSLLLLLGITIFNRGSKKPEPEKHSLFLVTGWVFLLFMNLALTPITMIYLSFFFNP